MKLTHILFLIVLAGLIVWTILYNAGLITLP